MALLFNSTNNPCEVSRLCSQGEEAFLRLAPYSSSQDSAIWGTSNRSMYLAHGNIDDGTGDDDFEKVIVFQNHEVGIGTNETTATLDVYAHSTNQTILSLRSEEAPYVFKVESAGGIGIGTAHVLPNTFDVWKHTNIHENLQVYDNEDRLLNVSSNDISLNSIKVNIGLHDRPSHLHIYSDVQVDKNVSVTGCLNAIGTSHFEDARISKTLHVSDTISAKSIVLEERLTTHSANVVTDIVINGTIGIGTNVIPSKRATWLFNDAILTPGTSIGVGTTMPSASIHTTQGLMVEGLTVLGGATPMMSGKTPFVNTIIGSTSICSDIVHIGTDSSSSTFGGKVCVAGDVMFGKEYKPINALVNGTARITGNLYIYNQTILEKDVLIRGKLTVPGIVMANGSVTLNGSIGIGTSQPKASLDVNGNSIVRSTLQVMSNAVIEGTFSVMKRVDLSGQLVVNASAKVQDALSIGTSLEVGGVSKLQGDVLINGNLATKGHITSMGGLGVGMPTSLVTAGKIFDVKGDSRFDGSVDIRPKANDCVFECHTSSVRFPNAYVGIGTTLPRSALDVQGIITHKFKRYGCYEPSQILSRKFQFMYVPRSTSTSDQGASFFITITGSFQSSHGQRVVKIHLGGSTSRILSKSVQVEGSITNIQGEDIAHHAQIKFYHKPSTQEYMGCIEISSFYDFGYDLNFEIGQNRDVYEWKVMSPGTTLAKDGWELFWNPLDKCIVDVSNDRVFIQRRLGIGEKNPQYMLDVKRDARFQSKLIVDEGVYSKSGYFAPCHQGKELTTTSSRALTMLKSITVGQTLQGTYGFSGDTLPVGIVPCKDASYDMSAMLALIVKAIQDIDMV